LLNSTQLRELKVTRNSFLDGDGFPDLPALLDMDDRDSELAAIRAPTFATTHDTELGTAGGLLRMIMPRADQLTQLRTIDLTDCREFTDTGLANLISSAPKIRALTLAKCVSLSDEGLKHIAQLGRCLHHLHLAHVSL
jgi:F-box and leucine-rich repeat protein GRR1